MADFNNVSERAWLQFCKRISEFEHLTERDEVALFAQCVALQILKSPATAKFPDLDEMIVNGSSSHYSVSGYVDCQNTYGAMIRENFSYNIKKDASGKWICANHFIDNSTQINNQIVGNTVLWWILGIIGSIITIAFSYWQMRSFL